MRLILTLCLLAVSLSLGAARVRRFTNVTPSAAVRASRHTDFVQTRKSPDNERRVERLQIRNQTGLDGKVRRIRLDADEDKPGIRAYGLPKKRLQDNGVIERVGEDRIDDVPRNGRLVEVYGMPKDRVEANGFIERLPFAERQQPAIALRDNEEARPKRSVREGAENKIDEKVASEAEDMEAQDAKVFRPLFVYRQQVAARESRKRARHLAHGNHPHHANHEPCYRHRARYWT